MRLLTPPDKKTVQALARLRNDPDFREVLAWLEHSNLELDRLKRETMDAVLLRMQQGGASAVAQFIEYAYGRKVTAIAAPNTAQVDG